MIESHISKFLQKTLNIVYSLVHVLQIYYTRREVPEEVTHNLLQGPFSFHFVMKYNKKMDLDFGLDFLKFLIQTGIGSQTLTSCTEVPAQPQVAPFNF